MKRLSTIALLVLVLLAISAAPAFADGGQIITGGHTVITPDRPVSGYLLVLGGSAEIARGAVVDGPLAVLGGNVTCAGEVNGYLFALGGNVTLQSTAVVDGDLFTLGGTVNRLPGAQVRGEIRSDWPQIFSGFDFPSIPSIEQPWMGGWAWDAIGNFFGKLLAVILAVLAAVLLPAHVKRARESVMLAPWASLGLGFLALVVLFVVGLVLIITICLAILGGLLWLAAWVVGLLGLAALGLELGERLLKAFGAKEFAPALAVLIGAFVLMLLTYLPCCIGALVWIVLASASLGAAILSRFGTQVYRPGTGTTEA